MPGIKRAKASDFYDVDGVLKDIDPEDDGSPADSEDEELDDNKDDAAAREHYTDVGKSKLRKQDVAPLGPQYAGARISRDSALEDEEHDPSAQEDEEEDEDEDAAEDDIGDGSDSNDEEEDGDEAQETPDTDMSAEDESDEDMEDGVDNAAERDELRRLLKEEQKTVTTSLSQAAKADVEKGQAVKAQRTMFDALLNTRIRLQKALIATNSFPFATTVDEDSGIPGNPDTIEAAEDAAVKLWTSLNDLRTSLETARAGHKRKRQPEPTTSTPSRSLWTQMQSHESSIISHRRNVLDKWAMKSRGAAALPTRGRLNNTGSEQALSDVLNGHLTDMPRLLKRARTPRSCAPLQVQTASRKGRSNGEVVGAAPPGSEDIFDDADFYTLLLRELVEQRSSDVTSGLASASISDMPSWQVAREARTKKQVDTRASKGRKLRYNVHEKLQNFMAPEDRTTWSQRQADELFGSLFGKTMPLAENDEQDDEDEEEDNINPEEAGLMLFRR